jgi:hypothetical protein
MVMNGCDGYTVPIRGEMGVTKCMSQAEYNATMTEYSRADQLGGMIIIMGFGIICCVIAVAITVRGVLLLLRGWRYKM